MYYFLIHPLLQWIPASSRLGSGSARRIRKPKARESEIKTCPLRFAPSLLPSSVRKAFTINNRPADPDKKHVRRSSSGVLLAEGGPTTKGNPELNLFRRGKSASRIATEAKTAPDDIFHHHGLRRGAGINKPPVVSFTSIFERPTSVCRRAKLVGIRIVLCPEF
jgi:hypothetical protein